MATIVFVHAHPDDEASQTSGSMAKAIAEGHRVLVVYATNGDHGTVPPDLADGETLVQRRRKEAEQSARVLGTHRIEWLGYTDSGMHGWDANAHPEAFANADLEEAAARLAAILNEEGADIVTCYDAHGGYGHPDHIMVYRVVHRAAELAGTPRVLQVTMNRDEIRRHYQRALEAGEADTSWDPDQAGTGGHPLGSAEDEIHWFCDVTDHIDAKRAALSAHQSQTEDVGMMLAMPPEVFAVAFGTEHYIETGLPAGRHGTWFVDAPVAR